MLEITPLGRIFVRYTIQSELVSSVVVVASHREMRAVKEEAYVSLGCLVMG